MKKDPLTISISLIYNLNLLEEKKEYNINELKFITELENHWITIQKYLNMFNLIQKYCPKIELDGSKLRIIKSEIYRRLSEKEKLILYLFNNNALTPESAIELPSYIDASIISESINYLYKKLRNDHLFLTKSGLELYKNLKKNLTDLIYNNKEINDVFQKTEELSDSNTELEAPKIQLTDDIPSIINFKNLSSYHETSIPLEIKIEWIKRNASTSLTPNLPIET